MIQDQEHNESIINNNNNINTHNTINNKSFCSFCILNCIHVSVHIIIKFLAKKKIRVKQQ